MSENLTDVDQFDATIQMPTSGETISAADLRDKAIQKLANRTYYNKLDIADNTAEIAEMREYCYASITGSGLSSGFFTLAINSESGGFTINAGKIVIPTTGTYECTWHLYATDTPTSDPTFIEVNLDVAGTNHSLARGTRWSATNTDIFSVIGNPVVFSATATNELGVELNYGTSVSESGSYSSTLLLRRIS